MTFANLDYIVRAIIGQDAQVNSVQLLRDGENDFIERTWCLEKIYLVNTTTLNSGTLAALYNLPSDFVKELRVEWNGEKVEKSIYNTENFIYNSSGELYTGTPLRYWIEGNQIRWMPQPSAHGYWGMWYIYYNTATGTDPIIPSIEHRKLANYAIYRAFEIMGKHELAEKYRNLYLQDTSAVYQRYKARRGKQRRLSTMSDTDYVNLYQTVVTE